MIIKATFFPQERNYQHIRQMPLLKALTHQNETQKVNISVSDPVTSN